jgi:ketosteroid isomerase-like protein
MSRTSSAGKVIDRLVAATNRHDLDAIEACFSPGFVNETPVHPARSFTGRQQVRTNWAQILGAVPDMTAEVVRRSKDGGTVWTEWEISGTRRDGQPLLLRGVNVFGVEADQIAWARFYLEPVEESGVDVDAAVRQAVGR